MLVRETGEPIERRLEHASGEARGFTQRWKRCATQKQKVKCRMETAPHNENRAVSATRLKHGFISTYPSASNVRCHLRMSNVSLATTHAISRLASCPDIPAANKRL